MKLRIPAALIQRIAWKTNTKATKKNVAKLFDVREELAGDRECNFRKLINLYIKLCWRNHADRACTNCSTTLFGCQRLFGCTARDTFTCGRHLVFAIDTHSLWMVSKSMQSDRCEIVKISLNFWIGWVHANRHQFLDESTHPKKNLISF